ncbi:MAG: bifunctional 3-deoxy-7-phosphoheptulonate synthase/chorismate mutase [Myxococcales bacterium]|nr:bifunctional 3-deoxy-7-phosphoheptulonate synthase/chorismate mutase [Myxococcales bacterium]
MTETTLETLREELQRINLELLELLSRRGAVVQQVQAIKQRDGLPTYMPEREQAMLAELATANRGPFPDETVRHLFREIFRASVALMEAGQRKVLRVGRAPGAPDLRIPVGGVDVGGAPVVIAGPCAVEDEAQLDAVGRKLRELGVRLLRGGAYKSRSSPYAFQGLGRRGLELLRDVARRYGLAVVTEVTDTRNVALVAEHADVLQVGARHMHNYELLREVGSAGKPVLLKRGWSATIEEFLWAAEYVALSGNERVILCERGIRTFESQTRNTLDVSAVALLRAQSRLPVVVDVSHAAGRRDILAPLARAALAAGAQGVMVEVHPDPAAARSDAQQQLDLGEFERFLSAVGLRS